MICVSSFLPLKPKPNKGIAFLVSMPGFRYASIGIAATSCRPSMRIPMPSASRRCQSGLCGLITQTVKRELGVHMTPHQFRHLAAKIYLDHHPEDLETVRQLLGHSFMKTTLIYSGMSGERASRAYADNLADQRKRTLGMTSRLASRKPIGQAMRKGRQR